MCCTGKKGVRASSGAFSAFFEEMKMALSVVVHGSFGEGFEVTDPFKTEGHALDWACVNVHDEWWVIPLKSTEEEKEDDNPGSID